jgi:hypothetical protein
MEDSTFPISGSEGIADHSSSAGGEAKEIPAAN